MAPTATQVCLELKDRKDLCAAAARVLMSDNSPLLSPVWRPLARRWTSVTHRQITNVRPAGAKRPFRPLEVLDQKDSRHREWRSSGIKLPTPGVPVEGALADRLRSLLRNEWAVGDSPNALVESSEVPGE